MKLYDLIAQDCDIWAVQHKNDSDIDIEIMNEDDEIIYKDTMAQAGWDSLVRFAEQVLKLEEKRCK